MNRASSKPISKRKTIVEDPFERLNGQAGGEPQIKTEGMVKQKPTGFDEANKDAPDEGEGEQRETGKLAEPRPPQNQRKQKMQDEPKLASKRGSEPSNNDGYHQTTIYLLEDNFKKLSHLKIEEGGTLRDHFNKAVEQYVNQAAKRRG